MRNAGRLSICEMLVALLVEAMNTASREAIRCSIRATRLDRPFTDIFRFGIKAGSEKGLSRECIL